MKGNESVYSANRQLQGSETATERISVHHTICFIFEVAMIYFFSIIPAVGDYY